MSNIGIITEQGDMGFGFDPLNNKDQKVYNEATKNNGGSSSSNTTVINETKNK